jgi:hypothetical protein
MLSEGSAKSEITCSKVDVVAPMNAHPFNIGDFSKNGCQNCIMGFAGAFEASNQLIPYGTYPD